MAYTDRVAAPALSRRRLSTLAGVAAVHLVVGYVFVTGMAVNFTRDVTRVLTTTNVPLPETPPPDPTPLPKPDHTAPRVAQPTTVTYVDPIVPAPAANNPVTVDVTPFPPLPLPVPTLEPAAPATPAPSRASGVAVRGDRASWITNADYPASAIRAEEQGRVGISVQVGSDGRVTGCSVTATSGSPTLDAATCRLYRQRARFTPARDDAGNPVTASYSDRIRWELPR